MDVVFDTADAVEIRTPSLNYLVLEEGVEIRPHLRRDQPETIFRVPSNVEVYLGIDSYGHIGLFSNAVNGVGIWSQRTTA
jgi:hypothetical protein